MKTITKEEIKERIIELNLYLIQSINKDDKDKLDSIRVEINSLINTYLN